MLVRINRLLLTSIQLLVHTFLSFYIWQTKNDLSAILYFNLAFFITISIASVIGGILTDCIDPKISVLFGNWIQIIQVILALALSSNLNISSIVIIGILGGFAQGLVETADNSIFITSLLSKSKPIEKVFAEQNILYFGAIILLPILAAYSVGFSANYILFFRAILFILILSSIMIVFIKPKNELSDFKLFEIFKFPGTNSDKHLLVKGVFLEGLTEGINITIVPIVILTLAGNLINWSYINSVLVIVGFITSIIIDRIVNNQNSKLIYAVGVLIFSSISIFLLADFSLFILVMFLIAQKIMELIRDIIYNADLLKIAEEDIKQNDLCTEYDVLISIFTNIGRAIPLIILLLLGININHDITIRIVLLIVGLFPLIILSILGKSKILNSISRTSNINQNNFIQKRVNITLTNNDNHPTPPLLPSMN